MGACHTFPFTALATALRAPSFAVNRDMAAKLIPVNDNVKCFLFTFFD